MSDHVMQFDATQRVSHKCHRVKRSTTYPYKPEEKVKLVRKQHPDKDDTPQSMNEDEEMEREMQLLFGRVDRMEDDSKFIDKNQAKKVVAAREHDIFTEEFRQSEEKAKALSKTASAPKRVMRGDGRKVWNDPSLADWPENDYRIHVGNLPPDATDRDLAEAFSKYKSFAKAKVIFDSSGRNRRYGFVSLLDMNEYIDVMKNMSNIFVKSRRVILSPSKWKDRSLK